MIDKIDKKILKILLEPNGRITSDLLAKKLKLPKTTVRRRRLLLEKRFLHFTYTLKLEDLGFRRIEFLISTESGKTLSIAQTLLKHDEVIFVGRSVGQSPIDLKAELVIKDNEKLLDLLEVVKGMAGVREVKWTEIIKVIGRKKSLPSGIAGKM